MTIKDLEPELRTWAGITERRLKSEIITKRAIDSGALRSSTAVNFFTAGDQMKIEVVFPTYGRWVDMGVGSGRDLSQRALVNKKAKKWYSPTFFRRVYYLYSIVGFAMIEESTKELKKA